MEGQNHGTFAPALAGHQDQDLGQNKFKFEKEESIKFNFE
jgi:hypothetical protein